MKRLTVKRTVSSGTLKVLEFTHQDYQPGAGKNGKLCKMQRIVSANKGDRMRLFQLLGRMYSYMFSRGLVHLHRVYKQTTSLFCETALFLPITKMDYTNG
jgi:hypothetical protein